MDCKASGGLFAINVTTHCINASCRYSFIHSGFWTLEMVLVSLRVRANIAFITPFPAKSSMYWTKRGLWWKQPRQCQIFPWNATIKDLSIVTISSANISNTIPCDFMLFKIRGSSASSRRYLMNHRVLG